MKHQKGFLGCPKTHQKKEKNQKSQKYLALGLLHSCM